MQDRRRLAGREALTATGAGLGGQDRTGRAAVLWRGGREDGDAIRHERLGESRRLSLRCRWCGMMIARGLHHRSEGVGQSLNITTRQGGRGACIHADGAAAYWRTGRGSEGRGEGTGNERGFGVFAVESAVDTTAKHWTH